MNPEHETKSVRQATLEHIKLLSRASLQAQYERSVPIADVPAELICGFCDDLFHPKDSGFLDAFNEDEIKDLAVLHGLLHLASRKIDECRPLGVKDLQKLPEWRSVMMFAKELEERLGDTDR